MKIRNIVFDLDRAAFDLRGCFFVCALARPAGRSRILRPARPLGNGNGRRPGLPGSGRLRACACALLPVCESNDLIRYLGSLKFVKGREDR